MSLFGTQLVALAVLASGPPALPDPIRVLFIGNSFTYVNNLPELVEGLAPKGRVETEQVTVGGATLRQLWNEGKAVTAIRRSRWDYVVLQEQSMLGASLVDGEPVISDPARLFWPAARLFDQEIRKAGAKTVLYLTWGQKGPAASKNFDALAHAYMTIGKELNALVVPVGLAWQAALAERADLPLYMDDGSHPAPAGSYLAAMTFVATLLDSLPGSLPLMVAGHATGFDAKPAASVGTLAQVDSSTQALFRRAVSATQRRIRQAGGYVTVSRPAMATLPPLPAGKPPAAGALSGTWKGTLRFFDARLGALPLTLVLSPGSGTVPYTGTIVIETDPPRRDPISDVRVAAGALEFAIPFGLVPDVSIKFRAVLTSDRQLEGRAEAISTERGWSCVGSWSASR